MKDLIKIFFGALILGTFMLSGCFNEPQSIEHTGIDDKVQIDFLFEKDGIKMYRFFDGGHAHYFTTNGETMTIQHSGKTSYEERIKTKYHMSDSEYHAIAEPPGHETKCTKYEKD